MFVKKVFQLVNPFTLHFTSSKQILIYVLNDLNMFLFLFFAYEYQLAEFYADFKSVEIIGKSAPRKLFAKTFGK